MSPSAATEGENMVVNMSCPRCGGTASEYDTNKWCCLKCGNKFLYAPPPPPQTLINANISVQGSPLFDLDPSNACSPVPAFLKKWEHNPDYFDEVSRNEKTIAACEVSVMKNRAKTIFSAVIPAIVALDLLVVCSFLLLLPATKETVVILGLELLSSCFLSASLGSLCCLHTNRGGSVLKLR